MLMTIVVFMLSLSSLLYNDNRASSVLGLSASEISARLQDFECFADMSHSGLYGAAQVP